MTKAPDSLTADGNLPTKFVLADLFEAQAAEIKRLRGELAKVVEERDEALNQLDSARHSVDVLEKRVAKLMGTKP